MDIKWQSFTLCLPPASQDMACSKIPHLWIFLSINLHFQGISHTFPRFSMIFPYFPWFSHIFPYFPMIFPWFSHDFLWNLHLSMANSPWRRVCRGGPLFLHVLQSSWTRWRLPHHLLETKKWHIYAEICFKSMCTMYIYICICISLSLSICLPTYLSIYLSG